MKTLAMACAAVVMLAVPAKADIERKAVLTCENGQNMICFYIWPALPTLPGWRRDEDLSYRNKAAFAVPEDDKTNPSPVVFLANAVAKDGYKTGHPGASALDGFIADDVEDTRKDNPTTTVEETAPSVTADGRKLRTFLARKLKGGHEQIIAYTEDGDKDGTFFCVLVLDSTSGKALETHLPLFRQMVAAYKHYKAD